MNRAVFIQLLDSLGPDGLLRLVRSERISCAYCNQFTGVSTEDVAGPTERFFLTIAEMPHTAIEQLGTEEFRRVRQVRPRQATRREIPRAHCRRQTDPSIPESATADALSASYATSLLGDGLKVMAPSYGLPEDLAFELQPIADGRLKLQTNLDFKAINRDWRLGSDQAITAAHLLDWILKVHEEFAYAGHFASEMVTNSFTSALLRTKTEDLLAREQSAAAQATLQDLIFDDSRSVREAINSGQRSLLDALELAEHGRRFRDWT